MNRIINQHQLDEHCIHKFFAKNEFVSMWDKINNQKMIRTASTGTNNNLVDLFQKMLQCLNMQVNTEDMQNIITQLSSSKENIKNGNTSKDMEKNATINIVSTSVKDSHYQVDISKDQITKHGKKIFMVSCYAKDAYLGRYLIKRNYFFMPDREKYANDAYDEMITKFSAIKNRYYNEVIPIESIFQQFKQVLDGIVSEIKMEEDSLGTTVNR